MAARIIQQETTALERMKEHVRRPGLSVIIPAYNEARSLPGVLSRLAGLTDVRIDEVLVVDDGSTDATATLAAATDGVTVLANPYNKGNGAAVKMGIREARGEYVLIMDADGQHLPEQIPALMRYVAEYEMVVGCRMRRGGIVRGLGNALLSWFASVLSGVSIPDLTSGFRLARRNLLLEFMHLFPNGFSFPATSTLAFISAGYSVKFVPVDNRSRTAGQSKIRPLRDAVRFGVVILRIVSMFYPLKVFVPAALGSIVLAVLWSIRTVLISGQVSAVGAILLSVGVFLLLFGLLADQIASIRLEVGRMAREGVAARPARRPPGQVAGLADPSDPPRSSGDEPA